MRFALLIEYKGTDFSGWQVQPNDRTVQGDLETAVERLTGQKTTIIGAGRTDAGVHAKGMVAHCDLEPSEALPNWKIVEALNALTSEDIVIRDIRQVPDDLHARFSAESRTYRYRISRKRIALEREYFWQVPYPIDLDLLEFLWESLLGEHDFTSFSKLSDDVGHYRCNVTNVEVLSNEETIELWITANRFVRGMVRSLVGASVECAKGRSTKAEFIHLLDNPTELARAKYIAPPEGLTFWSVKYPDQFGLW